MLLMYVFDKEENRAEIVIWVENSDEVIGYFSVIMFSYHAYLSATFMSVILHIGIASYHTNKCKNLENNNIIGFS